jgi:GcrA cell cycle regulator
MHNPSTNYPWDEASEARLKALWLDGKSATEIAGIMGLPSRHSAIGKLRRMKVERPRQAKRHRVESRPPPRPKSAVYQDHVTRSAILAERRRKAVEPPVIEVNAEEDIEPGVDVTAWVGIMGINQHTCRYPVHGTGASTLFCGHHPVEGKPYCPGHDAKAHWRV